MGKDGEEVLSLSKQHVQRLELRGVKVETPGRIMSNEATIIIRGQL